MASRSYACAASTSVGNRPRYLPRPRASAAALHSLCRKLLRLAEAAPTCLPAAFWRGLCLHVEGACIQPQREALRFARGFIAGRFAAVHQPEVAALCSVFAAPQHSKSSAASHGGGLPACRPCSQSCLRGAHGAPHLYFLPTICPMRPSHLPFWCLVLQASAGLLHEEASLYTARHAADSSSGLHTGGRCMRMARHMSA